MARPALSRLELNLLVPLDALLAERSVTRAAERLGLSQPSVSATLARLRVLFDDPLLVRDGNGLRLTPLARRLAEQTPTVLAAAKMLFETEVTFDPATSDREFTLYGSDYSFAVVASAVAAGVHRSAPGVRFRFLHHTNDIIDSTPASLRPVDGLLLPHGVVDDLPHVDVYRDDWVFVVCPDNAAVGERMTIENLGELPWVVPYQSPTVITPAIRQLRAFGVHPPIEIVVEGFLTLPYFILGTDRIGLVQARLAERVAAPWGLRVLELPFASVPILGALWWHPVHTEDPGHQWMRAQFVEHGPRSLLPPSRGVTAERARPWTDGGGPIRT